MSFEPGFHFKLVTICVTTITSILFQKKQFSYFFLKNRRVISEEEDWDYVLCMGDDTTDEDMFAELKKYEEEENKAIFSCMVKKKPTMATNYVENQRGVLDLLHTLLGNKTEKPKSSHERRMLRNL